MEHPNILVALALIPVFLVLASIIDALKDMKEEQKSREQANNFLRKRDEELKRELREREFLLYTLGASKLVDKETALSRTYRRLIIQEKREEAVDELGKKSSSKPNPKLPKL